ncbi:hypothetical protein EZMO1_3968 [Endozoicomonas montiporae CL-33]|uniref:Homeobox domain-containing protein n=1 Tax=Endozoicomonas montiporae CL-33 TaxID=570277 RepID=A0A142BGN2_9GAMM|nr:homeobox domain-containing protein [Endozoicomonas montiporae]AMO57908.1 hypothetical protein EZMO1_3968 [Endozoicomonas montiporae CL-33]
MACYFIQPWLALRASIALLLVLFTCKSQSDLANHIISFTATDCTATDCTATDSTATDSTATDSTATDSTATDSSIQKSNGFYCLKKDNSQHFCSLTGLPSKNTTPTFVRVQSSSLLTVNINNDSKDPGRLLINNDEIVVVSLNEQPETIELKLRDKIKHLPESQTDSGNSYCQTVPEQEDILSCYMYPGDTVRIKTPAELLLSKKTRYSDTYAEMTTGEPKDASHQTFPPDDFTNGSFLVINTRKTTPSSEEQKPLHSPDTFITALVTAKMQLLLEMTGNNLHHRGRYTTVPDSFNQELLLSPKTKFPAYDLSIKPDKSYTTVITYMFGSSPHQYGDSTLILLIEYYRIQYHMDNQQAAAAMSFEQYLLNEMRQQNHIYTEQYILDHLAYINWIQASGATFTNIQPPTPIIVPYGICGKCLLSGAACTCTIPQQPALTHTRTPTDGHTHIRHKRKRAFFTPSQKNSLFNAFKKDNYLTSDVLEELCQSTGLSEVQVTNWYSNQRVKQKKAESNSNASNQGQNTTAQSGGYLSLAPTVQPNIPPPIISNNTVSVSSEHVVLLKLKRQEPFTTREFPDYPESPAQTTANNDNAVPAAYMYESSSKSGTSEPDGRNPASSESTKSENEQNQSQRAIKPREKPNFTKDGKPVEMEVNENGDINFKSV